MILTDSIHIVSDVSVLELRLFACKASIHPCWFHASKRHPHYDKPKRYPVEKLLYHGAVMVSSKELVRRCSTVLEVSVVGPVVSARRTRKARR